MASARVFFGDPDHCECGSLLCHVPVATCLLARTYILIPATLPVPVATCLLGNNVPVATCLLFGQCTHILIPLWDQGELRGEGCIVMAPIVSSLMSIIKFALP